MLQNSAVSHRPPLQAVLCNFSRCAELMLLSACEISSRFLRGDELPSEVPVQRSRGQTVWQQGCDSRAVICIKGTKEGRCKRERLESRLRRETEETGERLSLENEG